MLIQTNMPWGAFRSDCTEKAHHPTKNAVLLGGYLTSGEAMDACNKTRRADRSRSYRYFVASSAYPVAETMGAAS